MSMSLSPKLLKRFYEALVLLRVLSQVQGNKIKEPVLVDGNLENLGDKEMRRRVMYHLCMMCDFSKGGDTVTAMAAENLPEGPCYWVAANGYLQKIENFLNEVLGDLRIRAMSNTHEMEAFSFEQGLFEKFVSFQRTRIKKYWKALQPSIMNELGRIQLSPDAHTDVTGYAQWLQSFIRRDNETENLYTLSQLAYDTRHSSFLRIDFDPITQRPVIMENTSRTDIRHYIGRLCAPRRAARLLTFASASHPDMFLGFRIHCQSSGNTTARPSKRPELTLESISGRLFSNRPADLHTFREALQSLEYKGSIMSRILEHYQSKDWKPRPHAELTLLEALYDEECTFYNDDKYIACSKAACFCCYHYICSHPGSFSRPSCHNKVYLNWQPPDVAPAGNEVRVLQQRDVMNGVIKQVRQAVIRRVLDTHHKIKWHPDSSTGITPLVSTGPELGMSSHIGQWNVPSSVNRHLGGTRLEYDSEDDSGEQSEDGGVALI